MQKVNKKWIKKKKKKKWVEQEKLSKALKRRAGKHIYTGQRAHIWPDGGAVSMSGMPLSVQTV